MPIITQSMHIFSEFMREKSKISDPNGLYFITCSVINSIDLFTCNKYREIVLKSLLYCQKNKGLEIYAYCLMTNHMHLIIRAKEGYHISGILRDLKSFTSRHIRKEIEGNSTEKRQKWMLWMFQRAGIRNTRNKDFQFWQQTNYPVALNDSTILTKHLRYTHQKPVRAGFVAKAHDWLWSSARAYAQIDESILDLTYV